MAENVYRNLIEKPGDEVIVALDNMSWQEAAQVMSDVSDHVGLGKINSLGLKGGWQHSVEVLSALGVSTMADPKLHDIPETVRLGTKSITECGAALITVHASGGRAMLEHAVLGRDQGKAESDLDDDKKARIGGILGITVLTSLDGEDCASIYGDNPEKKVVQFAHMALEAGVDGIVCSGKELRAIRAIMELNQLITVVPGITPEWTKKAGDQKRIVTPTEALENGADSLVIGRAITQTPEGITPAEAAERIAVELAEAR